MLTVTQLAKQCGVSRTTVLYYERRGLLSPSLRTNNGYRHYGKKEQQRLERLLSFRSFGIPVAKLAELLDRDHDAVQEQMLLDQFNTLENEIQQLRLQQKAIMQSMQTPEVFNDQAMTKSGWSKIMRAAGLSDTDMINWHKQFEKSDPSGHHNFLISLKIEPAEIDKIRRW